MSKGNTFENDLLQLIFNAVAIADLAQNDASSPLTELWVSLHTADPGEAGDQETSEATYTDYERVSVARASGAGGWTISGNSVSPTDIITFPQATGGTETITHAAIGTAETGTGKILYKGALTPNIAVTTGVTPRITDTSTITED
jgi:hypothetical protein